MGRDGITMLLNFEIKLTHRKMLYILEIAQQQTPLDINYRSPQFDTRKCLLVVKCASQQLVDNKASMIHVMASAHQQ